MKVLILNTHSILNSGDAAIVLLQIQLLQQFFPGVAITLVSRTPELDRKLYNPLGIKVLPPLIPAPSIFSGCLHQFQESIRNILDWGSKSELVRAIKNSDLVIASGGGYFWSNRKYLPGPMFLQNFFPVALTGKMHKPLIFFPQSFGPLFNTAAGNLLRRALSAPTVVRIFAREPQSRDFVLQLLGDDEAAAKVDESPDMAILFSSPGAQKEFHSSSPLRRLKSMPRPLMILSLRQWDFPEAENTSQNKKLQADYLSSLAEICLSFFRRFKGSVVILPQVRGPGDFEDDRIISVLLQEQLQSELPAESLFAIDLPEVTDPGEVQAIIANADVVIATRFHAAIFALNSGVPVLSIGYQPKSHETLKQLGLESFSMSIENLDVAEAMEKLEMLLNHFSEQSVKIQIMLQEKRKMLISKLESVLLCFR